MNPRRIRKLPIISENGAVSNQLIAVGDNLSVNEGQSVLFSSYTLQSYSVAT